MYFGDLNMMVGLDKFVIEDSIIDLLSSITDLHELSNVNKSSSIDVVDFFSGCGGMSYGFNLLQHKLNLYRHIGAFDNDKHANDTYRINFGHTPSNIDLSIASIGEIKKQLNAQKREKKNNPLVVIGCAPCQGFSAHKKKDSREDIRNTYISKFADIAISLNPEIIIMENVPDLLAEKHWKYYENFQEKLISEGYKITVSIVNFAHFGVPQKRHRTIVLASKKFIPTMPPPVYSKESFKTVYDAISHLPQLSSGEVSTLDPMHITSKHRKDTIEIFKQVPLDGGSRPSGVGPKCLDKVSGFYDVYGRLSWKKPAVTITARCRTPSCGRFTHPSQHRGLSVREAALLQGFPDKFVFSGPFDDKFKQIGNAVPPLFSAHLASHVYSMLMGLNHGKEEDITTFKKPVAKSYSRMIAMEKQKK